MTVMPASLRQILDALCSGKQVAKQEVVALFEAMVDGSLTDAQIAGFLVALKSKGESSDDLEAAAQVLRKAASEFSVSSEVFVDTCGTGGDGSGVINISTLGALVAASAEVRVVKHGNRALSSRSGSADLLEALGVHVDAPRDVLQRCLSDLGITFLFAPSFHTATKSAAKARRELGVRTIFNLLGPMTNPSCPPYQVVGVYDRAWCVPMAKALGGLGAKRAFVVCGHEGWDEISVSGPTYVGEWILASPGNEGEKQVKEWQLTPEDFGLERCSSEALIGGDPRYNAQVARDLLDGRAPKAVENAIVMAAAAALVVCNASTDWQQAAQLCQQKLADGSTKRLLQRWCELSRQTPQGLTETLVEDC